MSFYRDLRVAFHSLMRSKGLASIVILTLALGIGANAAIFTLVRGVLLTAACESRRRPPGLHPAERARPGHGEHRFLRARNPGSSIKA